MDKLDITNAARLLKDACKTHTVCATCPLFIMQNSGRRCLLSGLPFMWCLDDMLKEKQDGI